ncbi:4-hydroxyphenylacetate decarboxylase small subunit [Sporolituus thermophilus]|nr:4-hydroxyphenylacetate decarboxylase small subunit [Sporolituus thermophilus]
MDKAALNHNDCRNFIPIDVAKGICNVHQKEILTDGQICPKFDAMPKCKHCANFTEPDEKLIGRCLGFGDNYWTFGELKAAVCEHFRGK